MKHLFLHISIPFFFLLLVAVGKVYAQETPAPDEAITNIAQATYADPDLEEMLIYSNEVEAVVSEWPVFNIWPNNSLTSYRGATVEITHFILNQGNVATNYIIKSYNQAENDDFDLQEISWSASEILKPKTVANTDTLVTEVTLQPGEEFKVSYIGTISSLEEHVRQTSVMVFEVTDLQTGITKTNVDSITTFMGAVVDIIKTQTGAERLHPGDTYNYQIEGKNVGDLPTLPRTITIDQQEVSQVILMDSIPANLTFTHFENVEKGIPLYHIPGAGKFEFSSVPPENLETVDVIGVSFDSLQVGESFSVTFGVRVNLAASGRIRNVAELAYVDPEGTVVSSTSSNEVATEVESITAEINYYTNGLFSEKTTTSSIGDSLHIQATASACNELRGEIEQVEINLVSSLTGDEELFTGIETGANTGIFRIPEQVPTRDGAEYPTVLGNKILETVEDDIVTASLNCSGLAGGGVEPLDVKATVLVDPYGIVFDTETNAVIPNAEVRIIDVTGANNGGNPGGLAMVYRPNGVDVADNIQTSTALGKYRFPFLRPGTYRLEVTPPEGYEFSSKVSVDSLNPDRKVDSLASYGREFVISGSPTGLDFDIPLDPLSNGVLFAEKSVDRSTAEIGDFVNYTIKVTSRAVNTVAGLSVFDTLPFGFKYIQGTARIDGESITDPMGDVGPDLIFEIGNLNPGESKELTYRVYIGPGSDRSDGINTAVVRSDSSNVIIRTSNEAKVKIEVNGGVFSDEALIVGKVFMDCNENNVQDPSEPGIPGARLYLENGNYVITDGEGKYSFYAIKPNKHVLKIDNYSLPEGSKMKVLDNRHAFDPSSRFVDVKKGELHRADFAVCECSPAVMQEVQRRSALQQQGNDVITNSLNQNFTATPSAAQTQGSFNQASGTIGNVKAPEFSAAATPGSPNVVKQDTLQQAREGGQNNNRINIEEALMSADPGTDILNITDGDTLTTDKITVWAKGTNGTLFDLFVNGNTVPTDRIGQRSSSEVNNIQIWEYVSIALQPGINEIMLNEGDPFGNLRGSKTIQVYVPGELNEVKINVLRNNVPADGSSTALIQVTLEDEAGIPIGSKLPVTLDVETGTWLIKDANPQAPGTQTFIEGGVARFELKAPIEAGGTKLTVSVGDVTSMATIEFLPDLRPLIAAGIVEGTLRLNEPLNIQSSTDEDGFEQELKQLSYSFNSFTADARFAFFLKGKVSGRTLLTAGYDSEKEKEERLFRDIRPDEYYPVYGESAIRGYDAQSSGRLYIRAERGKTYALYGDFITQQNDPNIQLGMYNRSQNGVKTHFEQGAIQIDAFGVNSVSAQRIHEFRGQGISRYELPDTDIISNSEIIEIITYDREQLVGTDTTGQLNNPNFILNRERLTRFTDYAIDPFSGVITFKNPVSSVDSDFNPVFIRATYEVENDSERYMVGGVGADVELAQGVNVGANIVQDNNPEDEFTMVSGDVNLEIGKNTQVVAEVAHTQSELLGNGTAGRVQIQHRGERFDLSTQVGKSTENFSNQGASLGQARTEARVNSRFDLTSSTKLQAEMVLSRNDTTQDQTLGSLVTIQQRLGQSVNAEIGVRYTEQTYSTSEDITNTNLRSKLTAQLPFIKGASTFGEYEQDINAENRKLIALGGDYKIGTFAKAFARHEFVSSAGGQYTLQSNAEKNSTVFGLSATYLKNGQIFSEYRMNDALDGRSGQASIGLRNRFEITKGLGMNAGFERIFTVQGPTGSDGTSISTALDYTGSDKWKGTARAEARFGQNSNTYLNSFGYGLKLTNDWTLLARNVISINSEQNKVGIQNLQERFQFGAAYRDSYTNRFDALFRYEFRHTLDENIAPEYFQSSHMLSSHANYKPASDLVFSGRIAAKYAVTADELQRNSSFLELVSARVIYDLNERWDAGINGSLLANSDFTTKDYGLGTELGYIVATNLRLAGGYNFFGYDDEDLSDNNYTRQGAYLGFSYKFDERVFKTLAPKRSQSFLNEELYAQCVPCALPELQSIKTPIPEHKLKPVSITPNTFEYEALATLVLLPRQIHFDNDQSYINPAAAQMLDKLAKYLVDRDEYLVDLNGFTDRKASTAYNQALSERRSLAVRAYLVAAGVEKSRLLIDGFGEIDAAGKDMVEMALERRVEFDLNDLNDDVTYIDQVEDLQINTKVKDIGSWEYIFRTEHNAVPSNLNLQPGSSQLNYLNKYLIKRIAIALEKYPEIDVRIALPSDDRFISLQQQILTELANNHADITRYRFNRGVQGNNQNIIRFSYGNEQLLQLFVQNDDIKFADNSKIPPLLESLLRVLNSRNDYELLNDFSQSYVVPDRINFTEKGTRLDNESQAVASRIGSYLKNNPGVSLELRGDGTQRDRTRMKEIQKYLIEWGIQEGQVELSELTVQANGTAIWLKYKNADAINLLNTQSLNLRPGAGS